LRYDQATEVSGLNPGQLPAGSGLQNALNFQQKSLGFNVFTSYPFTRLRFSRAQSDRLHYAQRDFNGCARQLDFSAV